jgi:S1-C subfamily serine protease
MARLRMTAVLLVVMQAPLLCQSPDWTTVIKPAFKQIMRLEMLREGQSEPGVCTVVVINEENGYGLTAAHCVRKPLAEGISLTANGRHAEVLRVNDLLDLAVLRVMIRGEKQVELATHTPEPGTPVAIVGYAFGDPDPLFQFGYIAQTKNAATKLVMLNADVIGGDSGGACLDAQGRLVAINSILYSWGSSGLGGSAPVEQIKEFAENYLPKAAK